VIQQTAVTTTNAIETLAAMSKDGWGLVSAVNGQWGENPTSAGVTMFFSREIVVKVLPDEPKAHSAKAKTKR
jgi:hypothetical protein